MSETEEIKLACSRCGHNMTRSRCLASYNSMELRASKVWLIEGTKRLDLAAYFCEVCGSVQLFIEPEQKQQTRPNLHRGELF